MTNQFERTELLFGKDVMERLTGCRVAVFGIGGVGGYVCEALARSGIGAFDLIDSDRVSLTNLNRQIIATHKTVGRFKTEVMRERILEINPEADIRLHTCFFLPENASEFRFEDYDYVVDAVDTVSAKIALIVQCAGTRTPVISCMGAGNKLDPTAFRVTDIYRTSVDPLARVMRRELKKRGISRLKVVCSEEPPIHPVKGISPEEPSLRESTGDSLSDHQTRDAVRRSVPGSTAFVPSVAGLILAGEVIKDLAASTEKDDTK